MVLASLLLEPTECWCMLQQMQNKQRQTLMDNYDYVMFGRIFKYEDTPSGASNQVRASPILVTSCHESIPDPPCYKHGHPGTSWGQTGALVECIIQSPSRSRDTRMPRTQILGTMVIAVMKVTVRCQPCAAILPDGKPRQLLTLG